MLILSCRDLECCNICEFSGLLSLITLNIHGVIIVKGVDVEFFIEYF